MIYFTSNGVFMSLVSTNMLNARSVAELYLRIGNTENEETKTTRRTLLAAAKHSRWLSRHHERRGELGDSILESRPYSTTLNLQFLRRAQRLPRFLRRITTVRRRCAFDHAVIPRTRICLPFVQTSALSVAAAPGGAQLAGKWHQSITDALR